MNLRLDGQYAWVGGSSQGIGRAVALELAALGARVTLVGRNPDRLADTLAALPPGPEPNWHAAQPIDLANLEEAVATFGQSIAQRPYTVLINNTGGPPAGPITEAEPAQFLAALHEHLLVNHRFVQLALPVMKARGWGRVVNVVSTSVREPLRNLGVSNTTRAAVAGWAKTLAGEVAAHGITVNNVLPGATGTERLDTLILNKAHAVGTSPDRIADDMRAQIPMRRFADPAEVAALVAFLATPAAGYITGTSIPVDGGRMAGI
jgi:3-oxoacyl-[acyl-carrier protein] reductase